MVLRVCQSVVTRAALIVYFFVAASDGAAAPDQNCVRVLEEALYAFSLANNPSSLHLVRTTEAPTPSTAFKVGEWAVAEQAGLVQILEDSESSVTVRVLGREAPLVLWHVGTEDSFRPTFLDPQSPEAVKLYRRLFLKHREDPDFIKNQFEFSLRLSWALIRSRLENPAMAEWSRAFAESAASLVNQNVKENLALSYQPRWDSPASLLEFVKILEKVRAYSGEDLIRSGLLHSLAMTEESPKLPFLRNPMERGLVDIPVEVLAYFGERAWRHGLFARDDDRISENGIRVNSFNVALSPYVKSAAIPDLDHLLRHTPDGDSTDQIVNRDQRLAAYVHQLKFTFGNQTILNKFLDEVSGQLSLLQKMIQGHNKLQREVVLVPIPSSQGSPLTQKLAIELGKRWNLTHDSSAVQFKELQGQKLQRKTLGFWGRLLNLFQRKFKLSYDCCAEKVIVLVDDIRSSGVTADQVRRQLIEKGAYQVWSVNLLSINPHEILAHEIHGEEQ